MTGQQDRSRVAGGVPNGGEYRTERRRPVVSAPPPSDPPLRDFKIVGYERKVYTSPGGVLAPGESPRPAGICYHCGAAIMNCVLIENPKTDEIVDVGMTCAERVGLDMAALRAMLRERFQAEQREANRIEREEREKTRAEKEAADTAAFGEHGTESRWNSGCRCNLCSSQAPHGNVERLTYGKCLCDKCIQAAVDGGQYSINTRTKLVDLETRSVLHARLVNTRFGLSWVVNDKDDNPSWYPYMPARRQTMTKRGAVEVEMQCLVRSYHYDGDMHYKEVAILSSPGVDRWDEPIDVDQSSFGFLVQRKEEDV